MTKDKSKVVADILKTTGANNEKYFDKLIDMSYNHLSKLLKACTYLNK